MYHNNYFDDLISNYFSLKGNVLGLEKYHYNHMVEIDEENQYKYWESLWSVPSPSTLPLDMTNSGTGLDMSPAALSTSCT